MSDTRVVFLGTGDIAIPTFQMLLEKGPRPVALVTQPDRPVGRKQALTPPKIKELAMAHGIPVLQPENIREASALDEIEALHADLMVVMAYGQILPKRLLAMPPVACINLHASLLPRHRGASCIQAAIDAGDTETGITIMHVVPKLDAGDIIHVERLPLGPDRTGGVIHDQLADLSPLALERAITSLLNGSATRTVQDEALVTYAPKLERHDGAIDWSQSAQQVNRRVRAYDPWPGTTTTFEGKRVKIFPPVEIVDGSGEPGTILSIDSALTIACGDQALRVHCLQPEGKQRMAAADFARGARITAGTRFH